MLKHLLGLTERIGKWRSIFTGEYGNQSWDRMLGYDGMQFPCWKIPQDRSCPYFVSLPVRVPQRFSLFIGKLVCVHKSLETNAKGKRIRRKTECQTVFLRIVVCRCFSQMLKAAKLFKKRGWM